MMQRLVLAPMPLEVKRLCASVFENYLSDESRDGSDTDESSDEDSKFVKKPNGTKGLSVGDLGKLMKDTGHEENVGRLEALVKEWDNTGDGHIAFDNFISMMST